MTEGTTPTDKPKTTMTQNKNKPNMVSLAITLSLRHSAQAYATRARKSAAEGYWRCAAEEFATASGIWASIEALKDGHLTTDWIMSVYPNLETKKTRD